MGPIHVDVKQVIVIVNVNILVSREIGALEGDICSGNPVVWGERDRRAIGLCGRSGHGYSYKAKGQNNKQSRQ
jgi:hypothetical protein